MLLAACTTPAAPAPAPAPTDRGAPAQRRSSSPSTTSGAGFNPHLLAHHSPVTTALASLVLPSVFRPDADGDAAARPDGRDQRRRWSPQDPFTVSYELNLEASWTSNAPIAAEDFVYLWQRMRDEPGVVDAAGYRLITDVRSRAAGKAVDVVFAQPYPAWQTLFANLLPAHLLKDAPGSWTGALANGLPASGGPFRVVSVDRARGEVLLTRNDQYWDTPAVARPARACAGWAASRWPTGWASATSTSRCPTPERRRAHRARRGLRPRRGSRPRRSPSSPSSRCAPTAARSPTPASGRPSRAIVDRDAVRAAAAPDALAADAFALAPSQPGYAGTAPRPPVPTRPPAARRGRLDPRRRRPVAATGASRCGSSSAPPPSARPTSRSPRTSPRSSTRPGSTPRSSRPPASRCSARRPSRRSHPRRQAPRPLPRRR